MVIDSICVDRIMLMDEYEEFDTKTFTISLNSPYFLGISMSVKSYFPSMIVWFYDCPKHLHNSLLLMLILSISTLINNYYNYFN